MTQVIEHTKNTLLCKYCNQVAIEFDVNRKSKSGKLLPIEVASGVPHSCPQNPYNQQKKQTDVVSVQQTKETVYLDILIDKVDKLEKKIDKLCETYNIKVDGLTGGA